MIKRTDAIALLHKNLGRTEMLFTAMEKIKAYNRIYQMNIRDLEYYKIVKNIQDQELERIERSCGEHAIISLATAFETYYKELLQELLYKYPSYFLSKHTSYSSVVNNLIERSDPVTYEEIESALRLQKRSDYDKLFKAYSIPFLSAEDKAFVKYIVLWRNCFVHNAGRITAKARESLTGIQKPFDEPLLSTEAKRLRTKFLKVVLRSYDRLRIHLESI